ncbi:MAG: peptide chain release factor 2 [bacterium]
MNLDTARDRIQEIREELQELGDYLDLAEMREKKMELEAEMSDPDFWEDQKKAREVSREADRVKNMIETYESVESALEDIEAMIDLAEEEEEESFKAEIKSGLKAAERNVQKLRRRYFLDGEYDDRNAILRINPGAGGTEAHDWAEMLFRMYNRWLEDQDDLEHKVLDYSAGEEAGIKDATIQVEGEYPYGRLKSEAGVHRLVRISPFDSSSRRHTSFAAVWVTPEIEIDDEVDIDPDDLRVDTFRSGGPGGQHANMTDSAVRITHQPTGIVVSCQNERSQHQNKDTAMRVLRSQLLERKIQEQKEEAASITADKKSIEWGSQIRSYVNHPYQQVKDHRTDFTVSSFDQVLDGDLDGFIDAYLSSSANQSD